MSDVIIKIEDLGKKYIISHAQSTGGYTALRDVISNKAKAVIKKKEQFPAKEEFWALKDVNFEIKRGEAVGIIGRNGAGKSTLLKILSRITEPTTGRIELNGRVASLLEVGTGFHPELTGRENIFLNGAILGMTRVEIRKKFDEIVDFSGVEKFLDTPVKRYSSGMYVRLAFAVAAHLEPEILVVDEVLAVGDAEFQKKCLGKMDDVAKQHGRTVLFVSHHMSSVLQLCKKCIWLSNGTVFMDGNSKDVIVEYSQQKGTSHVKFDGKPITELYVEQKEEVIEIVADYNVDTDVELPTLGFIIYDVFGNPITGFNPSLYQVDRSGSYPRKGRIVVSVRSPVLMDGVYQLSIWFAVNSRGNIQVEQKCLSFEIINMTKNKQQDPIVVGFSASLCEYNFEGI